MANKNVKKRIYTECANTNFIFWYQIRLF
jgi:hypothetical protein